MDVRLKEVADEVRAAGLANGVSPDGLLQAVVLLVGLRTVAAKVACIANGDENGPSGLEALTIAVAGPGLHASLSDAVREHGSAVKHLADVIAFAFTDKETP